MARGEALFTQHCAVCHGPDAAGGAVYAGSIQGRTGIYPILHAGRGAMPPFPGLDEGDAADIEAWLATFAEQPPETPAELFALTCAGCHGAAGEGSDRGPTIQRPVVPFATWVVRNGRQRPEYPDAMAAYSEDELTPDELTGLLGWLGEVPKPADGPGLYTMFCANCHGADARGGIVQVRLVGRPLGELMEKVREGEGGTAYGARRQYMPRWTRAELTDAEVLLIGDAVSHL